MHVQWRFGFSGLTGFLVCLTSCGGGGSSTPVPGTPQPNPVPTLTAISPNTVTRGGPAFTLTVTGSNFISGAAVQWNGSTRPTTFVSSTQVTAQISADDIVAAGTERVAVFNPGPGGGTSNSLTFSIPCVLATPGPASTQTRARLGAYYFDGWSGLLTNFHFNGLVNGPYQDREPLSGWQDNTSCAVEQQLAWAHAFGINFFFFDWYYNTAVNASGENLNGALQVTHSLPDRHDMQFAILYADEQPCVVPPADWSSTVNEWMGYMTDPAYLLVNGKPLLGVIDMGARCSKPSGPQPPWLVPSRNCVRRRRHAVCPGSTSRVASLLATMHPARTGPFLTCPRR